MHPQTTRSRWQPLAVLAAPAIALAGLAGCGGGADADGVTASIPQVTASSNGTEATASPTDGGSAPTDPETATIPAAIAAAPAGNFDEPIALVVRPGADQLWLAERAGTVRRVDLGDDGMLTATGDAQLDIRDQISTDAERGLLGLAFSADGTTIYLSSTDTQGNSRLTAYDVVDDNIDESSARELFTIEQPFANHNGGHILWGPDGKLWLGLGDGGAADDPENRAQDPDTPLGKIVRFDTSQAQPEAEIVVSGVRNPWRFAFDDDGSLWIADVGQGEIEEIDHLQADEIEGANLGWSGYEGSEPYLDGPGRRPRDGVSPVFEYSHDNGNCSVTGGFVYRGQALSGLAGWYLFADYCAGDIRAIRLDESGAFATEQDLGVMVDAPVSFGRDLDGEPYVLSLDGQVLRLVPA